MVGAKLVYACVQEAVNSVGRHGIAVVGDIDAYMGSNAMICLAAP